MSSLPDLTSATYDIDLRNDGRLDKVIFTANPYAAVPSFSMISIKYATPSGYVSGPVIETPFGVNSIEFADLNHDGNLDFILTSNFFDPDRYITGPNNTSVTIIYSHGNNQYFSPYEIPLGNDTVYPIGTTIIKSGNNTDINVQFSDGTSTTLYPQGGGDYAPCFMEGTELRVSNGAPVADTNALVEHLHVGDKLRCLAGHSMPVRWIGYRSVDCTRHPRPHDVWPVRVSAGAIAPGQPTRDLYLSPDHAIMLRGDLIPIRYLLNGCTIVQEPRERVTYWHVELSNHDVLLAEGLPCESYLDTGNRAAFANCENVEQLHANFALKVWEAKACAPLVIKGPRLASAKQSLLDLAKSFGYFITRDPKLTVIVDGRESKTEINGSQWRVLLPRYAKSVRLASRSWVPIHMTADEVDARKLGVALSRLYLDEREVSLESPGFCAGWHAPEPGWRWTNGDGQLAVSGVRQLRFEIGMTGKYWSPDHCRDAGRVAAVHAEPRILTA